MTVGDELIAVANDYVSNRIDLETLDTWLAAHVQALYDLDKTEQRGAGLWSFTQGRIYDIDHGMREDELRSELHAYLDERGWLSPIPQRASS